MQEEIKLTIVIPKGVSLSFLDDRWDWAKEHCPSLKDVTVSRKRVDGVSLNHIDFVFTNAKDAMKFKLTWS